MSRPKVMLFMAPGCWLVWSGEPASAAGFLVVAGTGISPPGAVSKPPAEGVEVAIGAGCCSTPARRSAACLARALGGKLALCLSPGARSAWASPAGRIGGRVATCGPGPICLSPGMVPAVRAASLVVAAASAAMLPPEVGAAARSPGATPGHSLCRGPERASTTSPETPGTLGLPAGVKLGGGSAGFAVCGTVPGACATSPGCGALQALPVPGVPGWVSSRSTGLELGAVARSFSLTVASAVVVVRVCVSPGWLAGLAGGIGD